MPRRLYPVKFHVKITGPAQGCQWEGDVMAKSRNVALLLAAREALRDGVLLLEDTKVEIKEVVE